MELEGRRSLIVMLSFSRRELLTFRSRAFLHFNPIINHSLSKRNTNIVCDIFQVFSDSASLLIINFCLC
jgi:hypothetical protein